MVLHGIQYGEYPIQPGHGIFTMLLGGTVLRQPVFEHSLFGDQFLNARIGEQAVLILNRYAVQNFLELPVNLRDADLGLSCSSCLVDTRQYAATRL